MFSCAIATANRISQPRSKFLSQGVFSDHLTLRLPYRYCASFLTDATDAAIELVADAACAAEVAEIAFLLQQIDTFGYGVDGDVVSATKKVSIAFRNLCAYSLGSITVTWAGPRITFFVWLSITSATLYGLK